MQINGMDIIYIIVYNSWTTEKTVNAAMRPYKPVAPFSCQDVKSYGKEKYSVIHILYSLIIHYFNSK